MEKPWRDLLFSLLLGAVLALLCMAWLGRSSAAPETPAVEGEAGQQRSVGFEFVVRFRVLLPDKAQ